MTARSCATCKHLGRPPARLVKGKLEEPAEFEHRCGVLFVIVQRRKYTPYGVGDIVTWNQVQRHQLDTEPLKIIDPERKETNRAGELVRKGIEPFACRAWNADEATMPDRWEPVVLYDVRWEPRLGRYVRSERNAA